MRKNSPPIAWRSLASVVSRRKRPLPNIIAYPNACFDYVFCVPLYDFATWSWGFYLQEDICRAN